MSRGRYKLEEKRLNQMAALVGRESEVAVVTSKAIDHEGEIGEHDNSDPGARDTRPEPEPTEPNNEKPAETVRPATFEISQAEMNLANLLILSTDLQRVVSLVLMGMSPHDVQAAATKAANGMTVALTVLMDMADPAER